jgi:hypothetical protein
VTLFIYWKKYRDESVPIRHSILTQNGLAFLVGDSYLIGGEAEIGGKKEGHNFNIVKTSSGKYGVVDSAQFISRCIENANSIDDIRNMQSFETSRFDGIKVRYIPAGEIRTTPLKNNKKNTMVNIDKSDSRD